MQIVSHSSLHHKPSQFTLHSSHPYQGTSIRQAEGPELRLVVPPSGARQGSGGGKGYFPHSK